MSETTAPITDVSFLVEAAKTDTIYRDVYLRRARELLSPMMDEVSYRALGSTQKQIDEVVRRTRSAVVQHDWAEAGELAAQAEQMRKRIDALASVSDLARDVYDSDPVAFDPFSPGKHLGQQAQAVQSE